MWGKWASPGMCMCRGRPHLECMCGRRWPSPGGGVREAGFTWRVCVCVCEGGRLYLACVCGGGGPHLGCVDAASVHMSAKGRLSCHDNSAQPHPCELRHWSTWLLGHGHATSEYSSTQGPHLGHPDARGWACHIPAPKAAHSLWDMLRLHVTSPLAAPGSNHLRNKPTLAAFGDFNQCTAVSVSPRAGKPRREYNFTRKSRLKITPNSSRVPS